MLRSSFATSLVAALLLGCGPDSAAPTTEPPVDETPGRAAFTDVARDVGVDFVTHSGFHGTYAVPEITLGGVALFDLEGDGDLDLYLTDGGTVRAESLPGSDGLFRNDGSSFQNVTAASGVRRAAFGMGAFAADRDNDGDLDLYLSNLGPDQSWVNRGDGSFEEDPDSAGAEGWSTSCSWFDYDRDGFLDLWVCRYVLVKVDQECRGPTDALDFCGPTTFPALPDVLLRNNGSGRLVDVSSASGIATATGAGLGVVAHDFDEDGWLDVFVANDQGANRLWTNRKGTSFEDLALVRGVAFDLQGTAEASMGIVCEDLDGDLTVDLMLTHLRNETNTFYRGLGSSAGNGFMDATGTTGTSRASLPLTGFGLCALDADQDGDLDLAIANGSVQRNLAPGPSALPEPWNAYAEHDVYLENLGRGRFSPEPSRLGDPALVGRGMAAGDLDGDGDVDLVISSVESSVRVLQNEVPKQGDWVGLDVRDGKRAALGARVRIVVANRETIRTVRADGSFLASNDPRVFFGVPRATSELTVHVTWVGGVEETFALTGSNQLHVLNKGGGQ